MGNIKSTRDREAANSVGLSMTRDIFVNDARAQAVLPLETSNNSLQIKSANQQKLQRKKNDIEAFKTRSGFKNYLE